MQLRDQATVQWISPAVGSFEGLDELTDRELEVLRLIVGGCSNLGIADHLVVSERTVEAHARSIFMKLRLFPTAREHRRVRAVLAYLAWEQDCQRVAA